MKTVTQYLTLAMLMGSTLIAGGKTTQEVVSDVAPIVAKASHYYLGMGIANKQMENEKTDETFESTDITLLAGYRYNAYVGAEVRYVKELSDVEYSHGSTNNADIDAYDSSFEALGAYLKLSYPIEAFSPYALLGYASTSMDNLEGDSRSEEGFSWGVGATYQLNPNWSLFADYILLYDDKGFNGRAVNETITIDTFALGVHYAF